MTDVKKYLRRIKLYDAHISNQLAELDKLRDMITKITNTMRSDVVDGSMPHDKICGSIARMVDIQAEINDDIDGFIDMKQEILSVINQIDNADLLAVIHKRYVQYKSFDTIANEMAYTKRWVCKLHGKALLEVEKALEKIKKDIFVP